jgi:hypothetical protein
MFYMLVFTGLAFFAFGVAATLLNSLKIQREYELVTTELVRTDSTLRELEVKYEQSQDELNMFKVKIEASNTWTKDEINEAHGEMEKLKAEYVRVKVKATKDGSFDVQQVQDKCKRLLAEAEDYNKLLNRRSEELAKLKGIFEGIKTQLEDNQQALATTHEQLKNLKVSTDTQKDLKNVVEQLEDLKEDVQETKMVKGAVDQPQEEIKEDTGEEEIKTRGHIDTMKSFLSSLDSRPKEEKDKMEISEADDGE